MALVKRLVKGSPLSFSEGDGNLDFLYQLAANSGSSSVTGSFNVTGSTNIIGPVNLTGSFNSSGSVGVRGTVVITGSLLISGSISVVGDLFPYREFVGTFVQTGTSAPSVTVLYNTFPQSFTWVRDSAGQYYALITIDPAYSTPIVIGATESSNISDKNSFKFYTNDGQHKIAVFVRRISNGSFADLNDSSGYSIVFRAYKN